MKRNDLYIFKKSAENRFVCIPDVSSHAHSSSPSTTSGERTFANSDIS